MMRTGRTVIVIIGLLRTVGQDCVKRNPTQPKQRQCDDFHDAFLPRSTGLIGTRVTGGRERVPRGTRPVSASER